MIDIETASGPDLSAEAPLVREEWKAFPLGSKVEVNVRVRGWVTGTVVETPVENDRALVVKTDRVVHGNFRFLGGRGQTIPTYMATLNSFQSSIRQIEPAQAPQQ
jgi:hypothetical protein